MKRFIAAVFTASILLSGCAGQADADFDNVIPRPAEITSGDAGSFKIKRSTKILCPPGDSAMLRNAHFLAQYINESTGLDLDIKIGKKCGKAIVLAVDTLIAGEEAYALKVDKNRILIEGGSPKGVFYGIQTLRKAVPAETENCASVNVPSVKIVDAPRFGYRGMMLDVGRYWFPVDFVKKFIDALALHNMNVFHWHLTEDQGWRIQIDKYPKLTTVGSVRRETMIGKDWDAFDGTPCGGFYTKDEIREVVKYAADRNITVIPEIDLPGHMMAALASYPELGCTGGPYEVATSWGIKPDVLCVGNEKTFEFLEDVFDEVIELFPSEYIHVGGDEVPRDRWRECPKCQARIRNEGLSSDSKYSAEDRLQSYCMARIEKYLNSKGRRIIGWEEILKGDVAPNATVMSWRGVASGLEAARLGHDVIMSPCQYMYFDYYQTDDIENEPLAIGGCVTLDTVYNFEPELPEMTPEQHRHVIGVQANLWTEYISTPEYAEYMMLPRMAALSEVQWTQPDNKDWNSLVARLESLVKFYERDGYNYRAISR